MINVLYIHGMGGGEDSRIPCLLKEEMARIAESFPDRPAVNLTVRTYDFDPEIGHAQIQSWLEELNPSLIIGESLGSIHAIRIPSLPHLLISPALNAPYFFRALAPLTLIPGVTRYLDHIYDPGEGKRQPLHFIYRTLKKYGKHVKLARKNMPSEGSADRFFAFFGTADHYRRSGIVSVRSWKRHFGETYAIYEGTHFMEDEYIRSMVVPKIFEMLSAGCDVQL